MGNEKSAELFLQVRTAHRLLAAYYQRLLATIDDTAKQLELNFYVWNPSKFERPAGWTSNVFDRWSWDLLPGNYAHYLFHNAVDNEHVRLGECLLAFQVVSDTGILTENLGDKACQPDALQLALSVEDSASVLRVRLATPYRHSTINWFDKVWQASNVLGLVEATNAHTIEDDVYCLCAGFEIPLDDLLNAEAATVLADHIRAERDILLARASELSAKRLEAVEADICV